MTTECPSSGGSVSHDLAATADDGRVRCPGCRRIVAMLGRSAGPYRFARHMLPAVDLRLTLEELDALIGLADYTHRPSAPEALDIDPDVAELVMAKARDAYSALHSAIDLGTGL